MTLQTFRSSRPTTGGTRRIAGCRDWFSKLEHPLHISPKGNQHDEIAAVEVALADYETMFGRPLIEACEVDVKTNEIKPVVTIMTGNGGPFRSLNFELSSPPTPS